MTITLDPHAAVAAVEHAEATILSVARGDERLGETAEAERNGAETLAALFAANSEALTAATAALALPDASEQTAWLAARPKTFGPGWRQRMVGLPERDRHRHLAVAGFYDVYDAILGWNTTMYPEHEPMLRDRLTGLAVAVTRLAARDAEQRFPGGELARWLHQRAL